LLGTLGSNAVHELRNSKPALFPWFRRGIGITSPGLVYSYRYPCRSTCCKVPGIACNLVLGSTKPMSACALARSCKPSTRACIIAVKRPITDLGTTRWISDFPSRLFINPMNSLSNSSVLMPSSLSTLPPIPSPNLNTTLSTSTSTEK